METGKLLQAVCISSQVSGSRTPVRLLEEAAANFGDRVAVVCGAQQWTYSEFVAFCWRLTSAVVELGMQPGDRVAFLMPNCHRLLAASFAIPGARCVLVPLNPRLHSAELTDILTDVQPRALFYAANLQATANQVRQHYPSLICICFDDELLRNYQPAVQGDLNEDDSAEIIYTSGTTGRPKGALFRNRALYEHALMVASVHRDNARVALHNIPLYHANGWGLAHASAATGATNIVLPRFDPNSVALAVHHHRVSYMGLVPVMAMRMLKAVLDPESFQTLRGVEIGGAPVHQKLINDCESLFGCEVFCGYGMTEAGPLIATGRALKRTVHGSIPPVSIAMKAAPGVRLRVVDEGNIDVARDRHTVGEVLVNSPAQMNGYWHDDVATSDTFSADRNTNSLRTGDLATWDESGLLTMIDRRKDIIISGGEKISPAWLETIISMHPKIEECAVVAITDDTWGEVPAVFVRLTPGCFLDLQNLQNFLQCRVSRFQIPKHAVFVNTPLPRNMAGKVLKKELIALLQIRIDNR